MLPLSYRGYCDRDKISREPLYSTVRPLSHKPSAHNSCIPLWPSTWVYSSSSEYTANTLCRVVSCLSRTVQDGLDTEEARATDVELSVFRGYRGERQDVSLCRSILLLLLIVIIANSNSTSKAHRVVGSWIVGRDFCGGRECAPYYITCVYLQLLFGRR